MTAHAFVRSPKRTDAQLTELHQKALASTQKWRVVDEDIVLRKIKHHMSHVAPKEANTGNHESASDEILESLHPMVRPSQ
jgi:hypothetical protein